MIQNEIYIGSLTEPLFYFNNVNMEAATGRLAVDLVGNELSVDEFVPHVDYVFYPMQYLDPLDYDGFLTRDGYILYGEWNENMATVPFGTPLWYFVDGKMFGKFFVEHTERIGKYRWKIHAMSVIGLLGIDKHRGGIYVGKNFVDVLREFFGGEEPEYDASNNLYSVKGGLADFYVDGPLGAMTVNGLLPYDWKRENLHKLLFAYCVRMTKNANGDLIFSYLKPNNKPPLIPENRIFLGGTIDYEQPITDVDLTEYSYVWDETAEAEEVYDSTDTLTTDGEALIEFSTPINPSTITLSDPDNMTIRDANEITAYLTGHGVVSAVPYQIQERILTKSNNDTPVKKVVSINDVTLVNPINSSNLLDVLYDFYTQRKVVHTSIEVAEEKPGELYSFYNPYGELEVGYMQSMEFSTTSFIRADCEIVANYAPTGMSTNFQNMVMLTGSGTWTVPEAIRTQSNPTIRVYIMAGGQGGHGGYSGETSGSRPDEPGEGGEGGEGGNGGSVFIVDIDVTNIESFVYSCGAGGEGGESDKAGALGGVTVFGNYSSENGSVLPEGFVNLLDGQIYARRGTPGISGAAGGKAAKPAASTPTLDDIAKYGEDGESLTVAGKEYKGGRGGQSTFAVNGVYTGWGFGAGGGGAANGANGNDGTAGHVEWQAVIGGFGGEGATATTEGTSAQHYGCGGNGGHGGGGGGAPGDSGWNMGTSPTGYPGEGGKGSKGGRGAPGAILVIY